jgi:PPOX class probable F420-dependent enzyme
VNAPLRELPDWAAELLEQGRVAHLGFLDDHDWPRALPVTYALHGDALWTAVDEKPKRVGGHQLARVRFLQRRPEASLTVDRYDDDWEKLAWVLVLGQIEILETADAPDAVAALREKYAPYSETTPGGPLLRLDPARALCWRADRG